MHLNIWLPESLKAAINAVVQAGGRPFLVGGAVRDALMARIWGGTAPLGKDFDIEVHGFNLGDLVDALSPCGRVDTVGASFAVVKLTTSDGLTHDFSLPRRDNKNGVGTRGFQVTADNTLTLEQAAARRDFTMNSPAWNPIGGQVIDPFDGIGDIEKRLLRPTSDAFWEDPLRVLRGMQFAARFDMRLADGGHWHTLKALPEFWTVTHDRRREEWFKWALRGTKPSAGLRFLQDAGWLTRWPSLADMVGVPQDAEWHPEGDVWDHTLHVVDAAQAVCVRDGIEGDDRLKVMFGALLHDTGKPVTTVRNKEGRWSSPMHDMKGEGPTRDFFSSIGMEWPHVERQSNALVNDVVALVKCHMRHIGFSGKEGAVRRLALEVPIRLLSAVVEADHSGRPPLPRGLPEDMRRIVEMAAVLKVTSEKPRPILQGRHLMTLGGRFAKGGVHFKAPLAQAFEAQLDGVFTDEAGALAWMRANVIL